MRHGARPLLVALVLLASAGARAQVLPAGQEAAFGEILDVDVCDFEGASIEREAVVARYSCEGPVEVRLLHPTRSSSSYRTERFAIEGAPPALRDALLASIRAGESDVWWIYPTGRDGEDDGESAAVRRYTTWAIALGLFVLLVLLWRRSRKRLEIDRRLVGLVVALALVAVATAAFADFGPLHNHLTFTGRSDCARSPTCDEDRPGWLPPAYHLYEPILRSMPYRSSTLVGLSLFLSMLALGLQHGALLRLTRRFDPKGWSAALATLLTGLNPVIFRMSVAHTFYPMMMAPLWGAVWLSAIAAEEGGLRWWASASAALALAGTTGVGAVPVAGVIGGVAALTSRHRSRAWPLIGALGFIGFYARRFVLGVADVETRLGPAHWLDSAFFDYRVVPLALPYAALAGALWFAYRRRFVGAALGVGVIAMLPLVDDTVVGYPFLSVFPPLHVASALAAVAVVAAARRRRALGIGVLVLLLASTAFANEAWSFPSVPRPLSAELTGIEASFDSLPDHRRLVIPHEALEPLSGEWDRDPLEARFPVGFYREAMRDRGDRPARFVPLDRWLRGGAPTEGTLVYLGSTLFSFDRSEMEAGVPDERPILSRARERIVFEPVHTFRIPTDNHPFSLMRVGADRVPEVTLGFYRPRALASGRRSREGEAR